MNDEMLERARARIVGQYKEYYNIPRHNVVGEMASFAAQEVEAAVKVAIDEFVRQVKDRLAYYKSPVIGKGVVLSDLQAVAAEMRQEGKDAK